MDKGKSGPLASPWSSHRDLMGFRAAPFYDAVPLSHVVDAAEVHAGCGGAVLPTRRRRPRRSGSSESLHFLLRVAGAVMGVLPSDRRCFAIFVNLARDMGWSTGDIARALALTPRRIRQLSKNEPGELNLAFTTLGDARLRRVP